MQKENWVDYKAVKSAVSMVMVLDRYGVAMRRVNKTYLRGECPLPSHSSGASEASLGVNTEKNAWACQLQSCVKARGGRKGGNVLDFVAVMESCTVREAALKLQGWFMDKGAEASNEALVRDHASGENRGVNAPLLFALKGIDATHPYLAHRGIKRETAEMFGVGFFPGKGSMAGRIVIPIHNAQGELIAYAGRALDEATEPRYKLPGDFEKSLELYNLHRARAVERRGVIVVKGFFDAMKVHQAGFPFVVALMGLSLSDVQARKIAAFGRAILILGGDSASAEATPAVAARLASECLVGIASVPVGKQPNLLSSDDIRRILDPLY